MALYTIRVDKLNIDVEDIPTDTSKWVVIKEESYRPDKRKFVLDRFKKDYPQIPVKDDVDTIYALCSRSAALTQWLAAVNMQYSITESEPTYYRDKLDPSRFSTVSEQLLSIRSINREKSAAELEAANRYKQEMENISRRFTVPSDIVKETRVIMMNSTELPLSIQLSIENYTPAQRGGPDRKAFAREALIRYKVALLDLIKKDSNVDIEKVIKENLTK
jgi:hypothetical protein